MIKIFEKDGIYQIKIGDPFPPVEFPFQGEISSKSLQDFDMRVEEGNGIILVKPLEVRDHVLGLGEKAFELDRKRGRYVMYNVDAGAYNKYSDPLYVNIPFFMVVRKGIATGYFVNSASKLIFDVGRERYDEIRIYVPEKAVELFVFEGPSVERVLEKYSQVTGMPSLPPEWAFGYMISRYSYYPDTHILELLDLLSRDGFPLSAVFLDIDFMDQFKLFTWHPKRFPDPARFLEQVHSRGVKVITIVDHSVRVDQGYEIFKSGLGYYCETRDGDLFVGKLWPGNCVYPDFFREDTRKWWSDLVEKWMRQGIDGIWLDMNEPTDFTELHRLRQHKGDFQVKESPFSYTFPDNVVHRVRNRKVNHTTVRNAYPYYEAMATYEGMKRVRDDVFILSRSGYAGIQRFAGVWTGDNTASWEQLRLQIQLVLGLSISGVPYVGMDIGGFQGREFPEVDNSPEILVRHFQLAMFFPFFRTHKNKDGPDSEPVFLPTKHKERVRRVIETRYRFLPYLYSLAVEAHETGHPIIRPLFYEFQEDENAYRMDDEYLVGRFLLYAPLVGREKTRDVYLPGKWADFWTGEVKEGWIESTDELPIFVREGSVIPLSHDDLLVFNDGRFKSRDMEIESREGEIRLSKPSYLRSVIYHDNDQWNTIEVNSTVSSLKIKKEG
ncbi:glycoside hydrolase family 31 protein [Metallosphaera hakonensis JCM 8857 = DSM 7519]|uniref:Alpha-glucosidase n=2 Tax=Metallosphaera hakonensis TaxID=79601 RepID=A0A2U9IR25_9CREN|nr:alpha-glucosidase MalA [Metallosphaera hakonensis]AWR98465.1 glycoside hydrolase family 31 protein [Metallosphaera hakonensis JCM 8857 = DSM 7519]